MKTDFSGIICVADINFSKAMDQLLADLAIPEVFIQRAKQMSLADHQGFLGLRPTTRLDESRALIYRFYVPRGYEYGVMSRVIEAADLKMGGRGSILSQPLSIWRGTPLSFDIEKLDSLCGKTEKPLPSEHALITCIVPRGSGDLLAQAVLELGVCVPVIFFGSGMGFRDKLGLLRITIPIEKEIIWFLVPRTEAELIDKTLIHRARLDVPGQGFLYKTFVHAPAVNLRVRQGKRVHAATMEQVIAALDEVQGSSDWRRIGSGRNNGPGNESRPVSSRGLFFIGEEDEVEIFRKTAMENGARGATLNELEMRCYNAEVQGQVMESNLRLLCDIIVPRAGVEKMEDPMARTDIFSQGKTGVLKGFDVDMPLAIRRQSET